jgi:hypothetical protein
MGGEGESLLAKVRIFLSSVRNLIVFRVDYRIWMLMGVVDVSERVEVEGSGSGSLR